MRSNAVVELSRAALALGQRLWFRVQGSSMRPVLRAGDRVCVKPLEPTMIRAGDLLVYEQGSRLVVHRLIGIRAHPEGQPLFLCKGDALKAADTPITLDAVLGKVTDRERMGRTVSFDRGPYRLLNPLLARLSPYTPRLSPFLRIALRLFGRPIEVQPRG